MAKVQLLQQTDMSAPQDGGSAFSDPDSTSSVHRFYNNTIPAHLTIYGSFQAGGDFPGVANSILFDDSDADRFDNLIISGLNYHNDFYLNWVLYFSDTYVFLAKVLAGNDQFYGSRFGDVIIGFGGRDSLFGNGGNDTLAGGPGNDVLTGGRGRDVLESDGGADRFDFNAAVESGPSAAARDIIQFFSRAQHDRIDVSTIDANTHFGGNQAFEFIGTGPFTGNAGDPAHRGELRYTDLGARVIVFGDINGDRAADFQIDVRIGAVIAGDFFL